MVLSIIEIMDGFVKNEKLSDEEFKKPVRHNDGKK